MSAICLAALLAAAPDAGDPRERSAVGRALRALGRPRGDWAAWSRGGGAVTSGAAWEALAPLCEDEARRVLRRRAALAERARSRPRGMQEALALSPERLGVARVENPGRYVDAGLLRGARTVAVRSYLGTGKTTAILKLLREAKTAKGPGRALRALFVTPRQTFARDLCRRLREEGFDPELYLDCRKQAAGRENGPGYRERLRASPCLVIQAESLRHLIGEDGSVPEYDWVVLDESESVLHQFGSRKTMAARVEAVSSAFERCVKDAARVIAADAFLTDRTLSVLRALRGAFGLRLVDNPWRPPPTAREDLGYDGWA